MRLFALGQECSKRMRCPISERIELTNIKRQTERSSLEFGQEPPSLALPRHAGFSNMVYL